MIAPPGVGCHALGSVIQPFEKTFEVRRNIAADLDDWPHANRWHLHDLGS